VRAVDVQRQFTFISTETPPHSPLIFGPPPPCCSAPERCSCCAAALRSSPKSPSIHRKSRAGNGAGFFVPAAALTPRPQRCQPRAREFPAVADEVSTRLSTSTVPENEPLPKKCLAKQIGASFWAASSLKRLECGLWPPVPIDRQAGSATKPDADRPTRAEYQTL
jgi:hypothetical protein